MGVQTKASPSVSEPRKAQGWKMRDPHFPEMKKLPLKLVKSGLYPALLSNKFPHLVRSGLAAFITWISHAKLSRSQYAIKLGLLFFYCSTGCRAPRLQP